MTGEDEIDDWERWTVLLDVLEPSLGTSGPARWPEPFRAHDLDGGRRTVR